MIYSVTFTVFLVSTRSNLTIGSVIILLSNICMLSIKSAVLFIRLRRFLHRHLKFHWCGLFCRLLSWIYFYISEVFHWWSFQIVLEKSYFKMYRIICITIYWKETDVMEEPFVTVIERAVLSPGIGFIDLFLCDKNEYYKKWHPIWMFRRFTEQHN